MITLAAAILSANLGMTALNGMDIEYKVNGVTMQGYVSVSAESDSIRPVVVIIHDWNGIDAYEKMRADEIAKLGYIGFCADVYGKGVRPKNPAESRTEATKYYQDLNLFRNRMLGAVNFAKTLDGAKATHMAAIGYCFGGTGALELARSGAKLKGIASFHGGLGTSMPMAKGAFQGEVVIFHGAADPFVPAKDVEAVKAELTGAGVDFDFVSYANAVHSFTNPGAGNNVSTGSAYDAQADKDSWQKLDKFLKAVFSK